MSEAETQASSEFHPMVPRPEPPRWPAWVAWGIILGIILLLNVGGGGGRDDARRDAAPPRDGADATTAPRTAPVTEPAAPARREAADVQIGIIAKTLVGMRSIAPAAVGSGIAAIDRLTRSPRQKLIAAVVVAELEGEDAAMKRLDQIRAEMGDASTECLLDLDSLLSIYQSGPDALDQSARQRLIERYDYVGRLALSFGKDDSDPLRQAVLDEARRATYLLVGLEIVGFFVLLAGLALLIVAIVLFATGKLRPAYVPQHGAGTVYIEMFAVYLLSYVVLSVALSIAWSGGRPSLGWMWLLAALPPLLVALAWGTVVRGVGWAQFRHALGLHGGRGWYVEVPMGIVGYLAGLPVILVGLLITALLTRFTTQTPSHPLIGEPMETFAQVAVLLAVASLGAPVVEEIMFRGALFAHMRRRWNWLFSALVIALIFAAVHPQGWAAIPALGGIAVVLALIREWRGSILAPIAAHAMNNGAVFALLMAIQ
jgi:membrane protease YdiL (CAAX protease family)